MDILDIIVVLVGLALFVGTFSVAVGFSAWLGARFLEWTDRVYSKDRIVVRTGPLSGYTKPRETPTAVRNVSAWVFVSLGVIAAFLILGLMGVVAEWLGS